jgi:hypothetical protein
MMFSYPTPLELRRRAIVEIKNHSPEDFRPAVLMGMLQRILRITQRGEKPISFRPHSITSSERFAAGAKV